MEGSLETHALGSYANVLYHLPVNSLTSRIR